MGLLRKYAPELRLIEAVQCTNFVGSIDVAVPILNHLHAEYEAYKRQPGNGRELWFYTCCEPHGEYANRFIELPLMKVRLLHWINFRYGITGYLHWGWNWYYNIDPFKQTTAPPPTEDYLPAGDAWLVYPGPKGPLGSIRLEAMRDGIVDHELLSMLAERDRSAAERIVKRHVVDFDKYALDLAAFRASRHELLQQLEK